MNLRAFSRWQQTKPGLLIFSLIAVVLSYVYASRAIDSGSLLDYALAISMLGIGLQTIHKLVMSERRK